MRVIARYLALLVFWAVQSFAASQNLKACPLLGQQYPPPTGLSSNPTFQAATKKFESVLAAGAKTLALNVTSLSIGMFSTTEEDLLYQYHNTDALVSSSSQGTQEINADSIYRIGSISKLLTIYSLLISDGDRHFNDPIAEHLPELLQDSTDGNWITPNWNEITIGDLAGQMGGLVRDLGWSDLASKGQIPSSLASYKAAFPQIPSDDIPKCGYTIGATYYRCDADEFIAGVAGTSPIFPSAYTPAYSNEAFALIGLAMQNLLGKQMEEIFDGAIVDALGLKSTSFAPLGAVSTAVIPGNTSSSGWDTDLGVIIPDAGYYSSTNDLARIGRAILGYTLLSQVQTNRWMKPTSFVEGVNKAVGRPWEIFREEVNGRTIDMYAKAGDWGAYSTLFALIPEFDVGFSILTASDPVPGGTGALARVLIAEEILAIILPAVDQIAQDQAASNFGGSYTDSASNSSIKITTNAANSGLIVSSWTSNGLDLIELTAYETPATTIVYRLQPNQIDYGSGKIGFTGFYEAPIPPNSYPELATCLGWDSVDFIEYGNIPLGQMVFDVDSSGKATSVELRALRTTLQKA